MCGITGWVAFSRNMSHERALIDAMTATMACRGPDASGVWTDNNVALGHRRLAVIDLLGGAQPMSVSTPNGDVVMVYSGEAYNFTELRDQLIANGEKFHTTSDTEVVLRGYLHWGESVAEKLDGIVTVDERGMRQRKYWRLESQLHNADRESTVGHVRELLEDIVSRQLVADVPKCQRVGQDCLWLGTKEDTIRGRLEVERLDADSVADHHQFAHPRIPNRKGIQSALIGRS